MARYLLSFTACSIRRPECIILARAFLKCNDWTEVRRQCVEDDILLLRFESSRKRISLELIKRLKSLSDEELSGLVHAKETSAQNALCWIAICRTYTYIADFVQQIITTRWKQGKTTLPIGTYESFFSEASVLHPEVEKLTETTRKRLRTQLYLMLREMDFLNQEFNLYAYILPSEAKSFVGPNEEAFFPTLVKRS